jgi:hypothetical protein
MDFIDQLTEAQIAKHYSACMDSVNLINQIIAGTRVVEDRADTIRRNVEHLQIMVSKPYWTTENMTPITGAIATGLAE